ncbi:tripartite tricarboxylate transporter TctB family protein [Acuticoccus sp. MNP-M23]|uniref:tripartite tricarboxylate transporter TctB family protein n=1 Tax=Acuticoccus sp. MNP-M23 TaxID=3072793 RepID=UPI0028169C95|nr:tripartite tricarboxylate transporter TctB family protein [Acuticoccus sp. MNP-M23]WMS42235.1 tripartite tricarboxylate transporter TctB family protein [Acuticoccus sp. MNP-M23]
MASFINREAIFALFLLVMNTGYFIETLKMPRPFQLGEPGPAFLPMLLSAIMFVAAGRILVGALGGFRTDDGERFSIKPLILAALTLGFIALFEPAGYWIATLAYTFTVAVLFSLEDSRAPLKVAGLSAIIAICVTGVGYLFFVTLFDLYLPEGNW